MKMGITLTQHHNGGPDCMSFLSASRAPTWAPSALRVSLFAIAAGSALCLASAAGAQDNVRILGTVTQGEVNDVTRGAVMPAYDGVTDGSSAARSTAAFCSPTEQSSAVTPACTSASKCSGAA